MSDDGVKIDGQDFTLADLAQLDLTGIKEVRGFLTPVGSYTFEAGKFEFDKVETEDKESNEKIKVAVIRIPCKILEVHAMTFKNGEDAISEDQVIGQTYNHTVWLSKAEGLGRLKAFLVDTGFSGTGTIQDLLTQFQGHKFNARISHRPDKNDTDRVFVQFKGGSIKPLKSA